MTPPSTISATATRWSSTKLDRLARSLTELLRIVGKLTSPKGVTLRIINMGVDTSTPTGELILGVIGSVAQFERRIMLERQREGIAKAKGEGKYKGRKPTARVKAPEVLRLAAEGMTREAIAAQLQIGVAACIGALREAKGTAEWLLSFRMQGGGHWSVETDFGVSWSGGREVDRRNVERRSQR